MLKRFKTRFATWAGFYFLLVGVVHFFSWSKVISSIVMLSFITLVFKLVWSLAFNAHYFSMHKKATHESNRCSPPTSQSSLSLPTMKNSAGCSPKGRRILPVSWTWPQNAFNNLKLLNTIGTLLLEYFKMHICTRNQLLLDHFPRKSIDHGFFVYIPSIDKLGFRTNQLS